MSGSVNKVILVGNLGQDPEVRHTQDGGKIVHLSIATSERWRDRNSGEQRERTEWHRVVIFDDRLAEIAERWLTRGAKVHLEGQFQTRKWEDQSGQDRYTTEIVLRRLVILGASSSAAARGWTLGWPGWPRQGWIACDAAGPPGGGSGRIDPRPHDARSTLLA